MLLWNYSVIHKSPWKFLAGNTVSNVPANFLKNGSYRWIYSEVSIPDQWGLPVGYSSGWMLPRTAGYLKGYSDNNLSGIWNWVSWVNATGSVDIITIALWVLSLIVSANGTCSVVITATGQSIATITWSGTANISFSANGSIGANAFLLWAGSINVSGQGNISALWFMTGTMTPFTELSPQWLAQAIWSSLASENNDPNTMGSKLNAAGSWGIDLNALAQALWEYNNKPLILNLNDKLSKIL